LFETKDYIEQLKWERDTALAQLAELGYGLGEKVHTGKWITHAGFSECNQCHKYSLLETKYCSNCGIRMRSKI